MAANESSMLLQEPKKVENVAARVRKHRAKFTPEKKAKESARVECIRKRRVQTMTDDELDDYKKKQRLRKQESRQKKILAIAAAANPGTSTPQQPIKNAGGGYKSKQSLSRAVTKLVVNLPLSPRKQHMVVQGFNKRLNFEIGDKANQQILENKNAISQETIDLVKQFYCNTDIVYTAPGMRDEMTVWNDGKKEKLRKYYLLTKLKEAFSLFHALYPDIKIGFSKFSSLRPKNVLLLKQQPEDVCKCKIHENFILKLKAVDISYSDDFWNDYLCSTKNDMDACWKNECEGCQDGKKLVNNLNLELEEDKEVYWKEWDKNEDGQLKLHVRCCEVSCLVDKIVTDWEKDIKHVQVKRIQSKSFDEDKNAQTTCVIQFDFAMAYSCQYQNEVQSALWSRDSVNLFTAAVYKNKEKCKSYLVVTDSKDKGKNSVYAFLMALLRKLGHDYVNDCDVLVLYSDGPSSEFKNKYCMMKQDGNILLQVMAKV